MLHPLQEVPPLVEYWYSSCIVPPAPPLPAEEIVIFRVAPAQTEASVGFLAITGATGSSTTVHDTWLLVDVLQPEPVAVRRLCTILVPVTAVNDGTDVDHPPGHVAPLSVLYLYSSWIVPVPPLPAVVVTVSVAPAQTGLSLGDLVIPGATGWAYTVTLTLREGDWQVGAEVYLVTTEIV